MTVTTKTNRYAATNLGRAEDMKAQEARSRRYGIEIQDNGNLTKPGEWDDLPDSQWADPVNYKYPIPDREHAVNAKARFAQFSDEYDERSRSVVRSRINRLARKYGVDPIQNEQETTGFEQGAAEPVFSLTGEILLQDGGEGRKPIMQIAAARKAVLFHPWFGKMILDDDFFESMIDNWETNVLGTDVAIDGEHRMGPTGGMALGWVNGMHVEYDKFMLTITPTETGLPLLGNEYRYTSIEFFINYTDREMLASFGPVLVACAATNLPFVHRNDPIQPRFSISTSDVGLPVAQWQPTGVDNNINRGHLTVSDTDGAGLETEEKTEGVSDMTDKKEEAVVPANLVLDGKEYSADDVAALLAKSAELEEAQTLLAQLQQEKERMEQERIEAEQRLLEAEVDTVRNGANDRGVAPAATRVVCSLMEQLGKEVKVTIPKADGGTEEVLAFDALKDLLESIPGKAGEVTPRLEEGERPDEGKEGEENITLAEAEELAKKKRQQFGAPGAKTPEL